MIFCTVILGLCPDVCGYNVSNSQSSDELLKPEMPDLVGLYIQYVSLIALVYTFLIYFYADKVKKRKIPRSIIDWLSDYFLVWYAILIPYLVTFSFTFAYLLGYQLGCTAKFYPLYAELFKKIGEKLLAAVFPLNITLLSVNILIIIFEYKYLSKIELEYPFIIFISTILIIYILLLCTFPLELLPVYYCTLAVIIIAFTSIYLILRNLEYKFFYK